MIKKYWPVGALALLLILVLGYWGCNSSSKERYWRGRFDESTANYKKLDTAAVVEHEARLKYEAKVDKALVGVQNETKRLATVITQKDTVIGSLQQKYDALVLDGAPCEPKLVVVLEQNAELKEQNVVLKDQVTSISNERDLWKGKYLKLDDDYVALQQSKDALVDSVADCSKALGISERGKTLNTIFTWLERGVLVYLVVKK